MSAPDDALDVEPERADDRETWIGVKQADQESRDMDLRRQIAEEIAAAIEAQMVVIGDGSRVLSHTIGWNGATSQAAEIARRFAS